MRARTRKRERERDRGDGRAAYGGASSGWRSEQGRRSDGGEDDGSRQLGHGRRKTTDRRGRSVQEEEGLCPL